MGRAESACTQLTSTKLLTPALKRRFEVAVLRREPCGRVAVLFQRCLVALWRSRCRSQRGGFRERCDVKRRSNGVRELHMMCEGGGEEQK